MENKAAVYRTMVAYLTDLGADLAGHELAPLSRMASTSVAEMGKGDLLHYQRVLEAVVDNPNPLMDKEALKLELTEVVRERMQRGAVPDKVSEAREFRARLASIERPGYNAVVANSLDPMMDHNGHIYEGDSRDTTALCGHDWGDTYTKGSNEDRYQPTNGIWVGRTDSPEGPLPKLLAKAKEAGLALCPECVAQIHEYDD